MQASVGFGAALLLAPILLLIDPAFVPGPILISNLTLTLMMARREWSSIDWSGLRFVVGGRLVGTIPAAWLLVVASAAVFDAIFGVLVLIAVALSISHGGFKQSPRNLAIAGIGSGLMGTISSIGGPPVALVYQNSEPGVFRSTLSVNLILGACLSLAAVWLAGRLGWAELLLAAILVLPSLLGFWLSRFVAHRLDRGHVRSAVIVLSVAAGLIVMGRAVRAALG